MPHIVCVACATRAPPWKILRRDHIKNRTDI